MSILLLFIRIPLIWFWYVSRWTDWGLHFISIEQPPCENIVINSQKFIVTVFDAVRKPRASHPIHARVFFIQVNKRTHPFNTLDVPIQKREGDRERDWFIYPYLATGRMQTRMINPIQALDVSIGSWRMRVNHNTEQQEKLWQMINFGLGNGLVATRH